MTVSRQRILQSAALTLRELRAVVAQALRVHPAADSPLPAMVCQLEDRILLSAAPVVSLESSAASEVSPEQPSEDAGSLVDATPIVSAEFVNATSQVVQADLPVSDLAVPRNELLFVDLSLYGSEEFTEEAARFGDPFEVFVLDPKQNGIEQIASVLQDHQGVTAVHLLTHGTQDAIRLGDVWLQSTNLQNYARELEAWGASLASDADLLVYACNVAASSAGQSLIDQLAVAVGADVAASTNQTGSEFFGGDWTLEYQTGSIETTATVSAWFQEQWNDLLGVITVTTTDDVVDGVTTSVASLLGNTGADGLISLREAIIATNNSAGADTIFLPAGVFSLTRTGTGEDAANSGDLDITGSLTIVGVGAQATFVDGAGADRVFEILGSTVTMSGLTIRDGYADRGAGVYIHDTTTLTLRDAVLSDNIAANFGGAFYVEGTLYLDRVTIAGNSANEGGGICVANHGSADLTNVTISGNTAGGSGGAIATKELITITNSTIAFNSSSSVGGIYVNGSGDAILKNTILANNGGSNTNQALTSLGHNIDSGNTAGLTGPGDRINTNPLLESVLANNGGFLPTHRLLAGSPAINAGTSAGAPTVDQRGFLRDVSPDIGAYEYDGVNPNPNTAPVLDVAKSPALGAINEDAGPPVGAVGTLVSSLVDFALPSGQVDNVTDPDSGALLGIAIITADTTRGAWYYSINGGTSWNALGSVSDANARLLAADARVYFEPTANYNGSLASAVTFRAWDRTSGSNGALADASVNGGVTTFSSATDVASLVVSAVNDVPVITSDGGGDTATISIVENTTAVTLCVTIDADLPAQTLAYSISGGADAARFAIDGVTGVLSLLAAPNFEAPADTDANNIFEVVVRVSDGTGGIDTQAISVTVTDTVDISVLVVDTTDDTADGDTTSIAGLLLDKGADGRISLREALLAANNTPNGVVPDEIRFAIPDSDLRHCYYRDDGIAGSLSVVATTTLNDASIGDFDADYPYAAHSWFQIDLNPILPELEITDALIIDGYSQLGATRNSLSVGDDAQLRIELTCTAVDNQRGLVVQAGGAGSTIRGLAINRFDWAGIIAEPGADGVTIQGNFLGTDITGTIDLGNGDAGVHLRSSGNQVGGSHPDDRNIISGNDSRGVVTYTFGPIETGNVVENNYIGVDATGLVALANMTTGIQVWNQDGMQICDNVIAGNVGDGIWLRAGSTNVDTLVQGNRIGVGANGFTAVGNTGAGILIETGSAISIGGTLAGQANTIANNSGDGVSITGGTAAAIRGNAIYSNGGLGIDLLGSNGATANDANDVDNGPNNLQNFPVLSHATVYGADLHVIGQLQSSPFTAFVIDFYWSPSGDLSSFGEGQFHIGSTNVTTNGSGDANFTRTFPNAGVPVGAILSATATMSNGTFTLFTNTSEFAQNQLAGSPLGSINDSNGAVNQVAENAANGTVVGLTTLATDLDVSDSVSYSLDNNAGGRFAINMITGVVTVADGTLLDRETDSSHNITIRATSTDMSSSTRVFTISVLPVNDHIPTITSNGGGATAAVSIADNTAAVTTVTATDADLPAQTLTFSIWGGADAALFTINNSTGELQFLAAPDYGMPNDADANNIYEVVVAAEDGVNSDVQSVSIAVLDSTPPPVVFDEPFEELKDIYVSNANRSGNDSSVSNDSLEAEEADQKESVVAEGSMATSEMAIADAGHFAFSTTAVTLQMTMADESVDVDGTNAQHGHGTDGDLAATEYAELRIAVPQSVKGSSTPTQRMQGGGDSSVERDRSSRTDSDEHINPVYAHIGQSGQLWQELDDFHESVATPLRFRDVAVGSVGAVASGFTVGYVIWVLRSGLLLSSVLSLMPAWTFFDPLAVAWTEDEEDDTPGADESLEELVESASQKISEAELIGAVSYPVESGDGRPQPGSEC